MIVIRARHVHGDPSICILSINFKCFNYCILLRAQEASKKGLQIVQNCRGDLTIVHGVTYWSHNWIQCISVGSLIVTTDDVLPTVHTQLALQFSFSCAIQVVFGPRSVQIFRFLFLFELFVDNL